MSRKLSFIMLMAVIVLAGMAELNAQIKIERQVFGSGGMIYAKNANGIQMSGIVGQVAIEKTTQAESQYDVYQGFWVPFDDPTPVIENPIANETELKNYPNPFSNSTTISYILPGTSRVSLKIYDVVGNVVRTLVNDIQYAGPQTITWNGVNESGTELGSGSYIYELQVTPTMLTGSAGYDSYSLRNILVIVK